MNILYISSKKRWGGIVQWMQTTALELKKRGHRVWIVSHPDSQLTTQADPDLNIIPRRLGFHYNPAAIFFIRRLIKEHAIDLILTNIQKEVICGGIAARLTGVANIRRVGNQFDFKNTRRFRLHQKHLVDLNIVPCRSMVGEIRSRAPWVCEQDFCVIYNGKPLPVFTAEEIREMRKEWGILENSLVVGTTSQLSDVKRIDGIIRVFARLCADNPGLYLVITGQGREEENLKTLARELGVDERVRFPGFTRNPLLSAAAYDIAAFNSRYEGFSNSVVEFMAAGCPVVSTRVNGIDEIIEHNQNGLLVESGDECAFYQALKTLVSDPPRRTKLSQNGLQTVKEQFSLNQMINTVEQVYQKTKDFWPRGVF